MVSNSEDHGPNTGHMGAKKKKGKNYEELNIDLMIEE
jgi:hypothetical protein